MLYTKNHPESFLGSAEKDCLAIFIIMTTILFNDTELFEQIDNTPSAEGPM